MIEQPQQSTYTLDEARAELARQEYREYGHDYEHAETATGAGEREPVGLSCPQCGRSWPIATTPAPPLPPVVEEVAGYLVVDTHQAAGGWAQWISPRPCRTPAEAEEDRAFWEGVDRDRFEALRLAKLVLLPQEDQAFPAEEDAEGRP